MGRRWPSLPRSHRRHRRHAARPRAPGLAATITEQAMKLLHVSNLYLERRTDLAARARSHGGRTRWARPRVFFCNSGAEANEAAIKLAKRYQTIIKGQPERIEVLSFDGSFHGRTVATVALTGQEKYRTGFGPLVEWARLGAVPDRRERLPRARRHHRPDLRRHHRAHPGRGRHSHPAARFFQGARAEVHGHRHRPHLRRGADRRRPHRDASSATSRRASSPT